MGIDRGWGSGPSWLPKALASAGVGAFSWEVATDAVDISVELAGLFGLDASGPVPLGDLVGRVRKDDRHLLTEQIEAVRSGSTTEVLLELRAVDKDGVERWLELQGRAEATEPVRFWGMCWEITRRKEVERVAQANEARLRVLVRNTPDVALQGYDLEGRVVFWNPASEKLFGWAEAEALGRTLDELVHTPEEERHFRTQLGSVLETGSAIAPTSFTFHRKGGEVGTCLSTMFLFSGPGEPPIVACMDVDQTEAHRLRALIEKAERLESLGRLAGGVAHDFNNLLTAILGSTALALRDLARSDGGAAEAQMRRIQSAANEAAGLTRQLLAYGRRQIVQPREIDASAHAARALKLLPTLVREGVEVVLEAKGGLPVVRIDPSQLHQIIFNLAINASDAMPAGGRVVVGIEARPRGDLPGDVRATDAGGVTEWVVLRVTDEGVGMSEDVLSRVFEPFYTTKPPGQGTGLGLATCYGIARQNHGHLRIESTLGRGTRVELWLPAASAAGAVQPADRTTILVVEDQPAILRTVVEALERAGHQVLACANAAEALAATSAHHGPIHLLLSDLDLPGLNGRALATQLRVQRPGLRVLLISADESASDEAALLGADFLPKPFAIEQLSDSVDRILAGD